MRCFFACFSRWDVCRTWPRWRSTTRTTTTVRSTKFCRRCRRRRGATGARCRSANCCFLQVLKQVECRASAPLPVWALSTLGNPLVPPVANLTRKLGVSTHFSISNYALLDDGHSAAARPKLFQQKVEQREIQKKQLTRVT